MNKPHVTVVLPAYNAEKTLKKTIERIPKGIADRLLLVDDFSRDNTLTLAKQLKIQVIKHHKNMGYGANQKTCYREALSQKTDIVVMLHPDYQYDPSRMKELITPIVQNYADLMLGSRIRSRKEAIAGGMPRYKYIGNRLLTLIENISLGYNLSEYHTGYRAFRSSLLKKLPISSYSNDFVFDQQIIFGAIANQAKIGEIAIPVRYQKDSSSISMARSVRYGLETLRDLAKHVLSKGRYFQ